MKNSYPLCSFFGVLLLLGACEGQHDDPSEIEETGGAVISMKVAALSEDDIEYLKVTVSGQGIEPPIETTISDLSGEWSIEIPDIPAGENRTFVAEAFDSSETVIYAAQVTGVTIIQHEMTAVFLHLNPVEEPDPLVKVAPIIHSLVAYPMNVQIGDTVHLWVVASPGEHGDPLDFYWDGEGEFSHPYQPTTTWTAPGEPGVYTLNIAVGRPSSVIATARVDITVSPAAGNASVTIDINNAPIIPIFRTISPIDAGETISLDLGAIDIDGDEIFFDWQTDCVGSFSDTSEQSPSFTLDEITSDTCTFSVLITDSRGASRRAQVTIDTGPPTMPEEPYCGNGIVEKGETCDPPHTCPTFCYDNDVCTEDRLVGSADDCNAVCEFPEHSVCISGDGCCPFGCYTYEDSDCEPVCGDENCPCTLENGCIDRNEGFLEVVDVAFNLNDDPNSISDSDTYSYFGVSAHNIPSVSPVCDVEVVSDTHLSSPTDIYELRFIAHGSASIDMGGGGVSLRVILHDSSATEHTIFSYSYGGNGGYHASFDETVSSGGIPWQNIERVSIELSAGANGPPPPYFYPECVATAQIFELQISGIAD